MSSPKRGYRKSALYLGNSLHTFGPLGRRYILGAVPTVRGYVSTYGQSDYSRWTFIFEGTEHELTISRGYSERGLIRIARQFAQSIIDGAPLGADT